MKIQVTVDGETSDVDIEVESLTLQESVTIEEVLGVDGYDRFLADTEAGTPFKRPSSMRALIFSKVKSQFPDAKPTDFDIEMGDLMEDDSADGDSGKDSDGE